MNQHLSTYELGTLQRFSDRVAMWHEAGHAVVAMHYGKKVRSLGLDPLPHCLVSQVGLTSHQKGVLLCAGAAFTKEVFGFEWGGEASDYPMARQLGDLEVFKAEAESLAKELKAQAKHLVDARLGKFSESDKARGFDSQWYGVSPDEDLPELEETDLHYAECQRVAEKGELPKFAKKLLAKAATFQMRNPKMAVKLATLWR